MTEPDAPNEASEQIRADYTLPGADHSCADFLDFTPLEDGYGVWYCARCGGTVQVGGHYDPDPEALARYEKVITQIESQR